MKSVKFLNGDVYLVPETEIGEIKKALIKIYEGKLRLHRLQLTDVKSEENKENNDNNDNNTIDYLAWQEPPNVSKTIVSIFPKSTLFRMKWLDSQQLLDLLDYLDDATDDHPHEMVTVQMRSNHEIPCKIWGKIAQNIACRWNPRKLIVIWDSDPLLKQGTWRDLSTFIGHFRDIRNLEIVCDPGDICPVETISQNCTHLENIIIPLICESSSLAKLFSLPNLHTLIMRTGSQTPSHPEFMPKHWETELDDFNRMIIFRKKIIKDT